MKKKTIQFVEVEGPPASSDATDSLRGAMFAMATACRKAGMSMSEFGKAVAHHPIIDYIDYPDRIGTGKGLITRMSDLEKEINKIKKQIRPRA